MIDQRKRPDTRRTLALMTVGTACAVYLISMFVEVETARFSQIVQGSQALALFALGFYFGSMQGDKPGSAADRRPDGTVTTQTLVATETTTEGKRDADNP